VHRPLEQVAPVAQASPSPGSGTQVVPLQRNPAAQSAVPAHVFLQAVAPQAYAPQAVATSEHLPAPSHALTCVSMPLAQPSTPQAAEAFG